MKKPNFSTRSISVASFLLGLLTLTTSNLYFASSEPDSILGCANKKTGVLRIAAKCANTERAIQWSKTGPVGPEGPVGPVGIAGPKGETGAAGPAGEVGPQGLPGLNGLNGFSGSNGPAGPAGAPGRQLLVRDSTNAFVGYFAGTLTTSMVAETTPSGNFYQNAVQVWDPNLELLFIYSFSGRPITSYVLFSQPSCTGQAYLANNGSQVGDPAEAPRFVAHSSSSNGPIQWFERATDVYVAGVISIASAPHYSNNCDPGSEFGDENFSGNIPHIVLNPISSPVPTFTGPLRITLS